MNLSNVATVMAPNLFPNLMPNLLMRPSKKSGKSENLDFNKISSNEIERASNSCLITRMLIKYHSTLYHVS